MQNSWLVLGDEVSLDSDGLRLGPVDMVVFTVSIVANKSSFVGAFLEAFFDAPEVEGPF